MNIQNRNLIKFIFKGAAIGTVVGVTAWGVGELAVRFIERVTTSQGNVGDSTERHALFESNKLLGPK